MVTFRDFVSAFRKLEIDRNQPLIVHTSLSAFGQVHGGPDAVLGALLACFDTVVMPTFTYKTMIMPEVGPADNGVVYGSAKEANMMAEFFRPDMPADRMMGVVADKLRSHSKAMRSSHPILSFAGINAEAALESQTMAEPLNPIGVLHEQNGWVLLLGVDHTVNTSIHYAERKAGRKQFLRWALTSQGVVESPGFPGCSLGFQALEPRLALYNRRIALGGSQINAIPLVGLIDVVTGWLAEDPTALLCNRVDCGRCNAVRTNVAQKSAA